ncbi:MAG: XdhC family protein [Notoacmeibacter sp.]
MDPYALKKLNAARRARKAAVLATDLTDGRDRVIEEGDPVAGALGDAIGRVFQSGKAEQTTIEDRIFFINPHLPEPRMVIVGAVHISQALAPMARLAGFEVVIIDPRTAFASPERFGNFTLHAEWPQLVLENEPLDRHTALVAVTHDPKIDDGAILAALKAKCIYVGALGSRKTQGARVERLLASGAKAQDISRIKAPIGLNIGATSPAEIAVSILAEVIAAFRLAEVRP